MKQIKGAIKFTTLPLFVDVKCLYGPRHTLTHFYVRMRNLIITYKLSKLSYSVFRIQKEIYEYHNSCLTISNIIMNIVSSNIEVYTKKISYRYHR